MPDKKTAPADQPPSEKKDFLRREEIKTMQKEIYRVREEGAQKEREKITSMETEKEKPSFANPPASKATVPENKEKIKPEGKKAPSQSPQIEEEAAQRAPLDQPGQIEAELKELSSRMQSLASKKNQIIAEAEKLRIGLTPVHEKERIIEAKKKTIEEKESKAANAEEKKTIETQRWEIEKQRQEIEKERWSIEEDIESCQSELGKIQAEWQKILSEKKEMERQQEEIEKKEMESKLKKERVMLEKELKEIDTVWSSIEEEKNSQLAKKNKTADDLQKILDEEKNTEDAIKQLEQRENAAAVPQEKRQIEQGRQQMEQKRAELEKNRWAMETEDNNARLSLKKIESSQRASASRKDSIKKRVDEIDSQIFSHKEEAPVEQKMTAETAAKVESVERQNIPQKETQVWSRPERYFDERAESPRYQEMPKMHDKQPAEPESQEEAARRIFLQRTQELENKKAALSPEIAPKEYQQSPTPPKPLHQRQSPVEKAWVRVLLILLIIVILLFLASFWYWYLIISK